MKKLNLSKEDIIQRFNETYSKDDSLSEVQILDDYIRAYDKSEDRDVYFYFPKINYDNLFDFGDVRVDKEKFFKLLDSLDTTLFMTIKEIVFLSSEKETSFLRKTHEDEVFPKEYLSFLMREDSKIVINIFSIKRILKEEGIELPSKDIIMTLLFELLKDRKDNPLLIGGEISFRDDKGTLLRETADMFKEYIQPFDFNCFEI